MPFGVLIIDRLEKGKEAKEEQETGLKLMGLTSSDLMSKEKLSIAIEMGEMRDSSSEGEQSTSLCIFQEQWFSRCGPQNSSTSICWVLLDMYILGSPPDLLGTRDCGGEGQPSAF